MEAQPVATTTAGAVAVSQNPSQATNEEPAVQSQVETKEDIDNLATDESSVACGSCNKLFLVSESRFKCDVYTGVNNVFHKKCTGMSEYSTLGVFRSA
jgi:hypothetical protein